MKIKSTLRLLIILITLPVHSQPTANSSDLTTTSYYVHYYGTISNFNTKGGSNQVWDFSNVAFSSMGTSHLVTQVDTTRYFSKFPTANCALIESDGSYSYLIKSADSLVEIGGVRGNEWVIYADYVKRFVFPLSFQQSFTDTYNGKYNDNSTEIGTASYYYDAYGTLKTPFGTYNNVIRLQYIKNTEQRFQFWTTNPFMIIGEYSVSNQILILRIPKQSITPSQPPVLQQSKLALSGQYNAYAGYLPFAATYSGADQLWDYSNVTTTYVGYNVITSKTDTTKYYNLFPNSNWVVIGSDGSYNYMKFTADSLFTLGGAQGTNTLIYNNYRKELIFPFTYTSSYSDVYTGGKNGNATVIYDAYGTLKTPFDTYNQVVRLMYINGSNVTYKFWTTDPIMEMAEYSVTNQNIIFRSQKTILASLQVEEPTIKISVRNHWMSIDSENKINAISIYDMQGKLIKSANTKSMNLSGINNGIYFVKIKIDNATVTRKIAIN